MAGWKLRVKRLFSLSFLVIILLPTLFPTSFEISPVLASEEEEEDNFTTMPHWRWRNISTTSGTTEHLIGDVYEILALNNPTGTSVLRKARGLNSRDFYFDTRFAIETGGSSIEMFLDEKGDMCDWEESDTEQWLAEVGSTQALTYAGYVRYARTGATSVFGGKYSPYSYGGNLFTYVYKTIEFRIKALGQGTQYNLRFEFKKSAGDAYESIVVESGDIPYEATTYRVDLSNNPVWKSDGYVHTFRIVAQTDNNGVFLLDHVRVLGKMDWATFVSGEYENTHDFVLDDSDEYWLDDYGNVSDFNDGSTEVWNIDPIEQLYPNLITWYKMDEGLGTTVEDSSGSNDGSFVGSLNWNNTHKIDGYSLEFSESSEYVNVPDNDVLTDIDAFSVDLWLYLGYPNPNVTSNNEMQWVAKRDASANYEWQFETVYKSGFGYLPKFTLYSQNTSGNYIEGRVSGSYIQSGFHHITWVYNGNATKEGISVYLNGSFNYAGGASSGSFTSIVNTDSTLKMGTFDPFAPTTMSATLDNVRIWDKELTSSEISQLYNQAPSYPFGESRIQPTLSNYNQWLNVSTGISESGFDYSNINLWYKFEEGSGTTINDNSGNGLTGTYVDGTGSPHWSTDTMHPDSTYCVDLELSEGQFIVANDNDLLSFGNITHDFPFSFDFWIKPESIPDDMVLISKDGTLTEYEVQIHSSARVEFWLGDTSRGGSLYKYTNTGAISVGTLYHITLTYDGSGSASGMKIYFNGTEQSYSASGVSGTYIAMENTNRLFYIGRNSEGNYDGLIDEFRLWNIELNEAQIQELYSRAPHIPIGGRTQIYSDNFTSPNIDRSKYDRFMFEIKAIEGDIEAIQILNASDTLIADYSFPSLLTEGSTELLALNLDWSGTSGNDELLKLDVIFDEKTPYSPVEYHLNFTEIRDITTTALDNWIYTKGAYISDQLLTISANSTIDLEHALTKNIETKYFDNLVIRLRASEAGMLNAKAYRTSWVQVSDKIAFDEGWNYISINLAPNQTCNWLAQTAYYKLGFEFYNSSGLAIEGDILLEIDYIFLYGHFAEDQGFKFTLLNQDGYIGMSWIFTRRGSGDFETYVVTIDMYDYSGVSLHFEQEFDYSVYDDGWLRLDVDWHLDKKKIKMIFEYDNGTDIINTRTFSAIYPDVPTQLRLLLLEDGFPSFMIDNSIGGFSKSYVWIDYIDADWLIHEWVTPSDGSVWTDGTWGNLWQNNTNQFDAESPYGVRLEDYSTNKSQRYYYLAVDRFDALKFDWKTEWYSLDYSAPELDWLFFQFYAYNVLEDGSLERVCEFNFVQYLVGPLADQCSVVDRTGTSVYFNSATGTAYGAEGSISLFRESEDKIILNLHWKTNLPKEDRGNLVFRPVDKYTKEMVFVFAYSFRTWVSGVSAYEGGEVAIHGFELTRKGLIGDIVQGILTPILGALAILFSPLMLFLQFILASLVKLFQALLAGLVTGLSPLLTAIVTGLSPILEGIISALDVFLDPILGFVGEIVELINEFAPLLLEIFLAAIEEYVTFLEEFWGLVIDAIILPFLFDLFDSLGLLPLLEFVLQFIGDLMAIIGDVIALVSAYLGYLFASAVYWFDVGRLGALACWIIFFVVIYVFSPVLTLWTQDFESLTLEEITDAMATMFERAFSLIVFAFTITTYIFDFIFNVLKTIGNYIPFT